MCSKPCQTSKMVLLTVNMQLTIFTRSSNLDIFQGSNYASSQYIFVFSPYVGMYQGSIKYYVHLNKQVGRVPQMHMFPNEEVEMRNWVNIFCMYTAIKP